jgi:hypothetical protein
VVEQKLPLTGLASVKKAAEFPYAFDNGLSFKSIFDHI